MTVDRNEKDRRFDMNKAQLLALDKLSSSTLDQLRTERPELHAALAGRIAKERKSAVVAAFKGVSQELSNHLSKLDFHSPDAQDKSLPDNVIATLQAQRARPEIAKEAIGRLLELERSDLLVDPAQRDTPLEAHPLFQEDLQAAKLFKVTDVAGMPDDKATRLVASAKSVTAIGDGTLASLVKEQLLTEEDAKRLGLAATVFHVADGRPELARALGDRVQSVRELASLRVDEWESALERAKVAMPEGTTTAEYAESLRRRVTALFPTEAFFERLPKPADIVGPLERVATLLRRDPKALSMEFDRLDVGSIGDVERAELRKAHEDAVRLANEYPGLRLHDVLSSDAPAVDKASAVAKRLELVQRVMRLNPETELLSVDYAPGSADLASLKLDELADDEKKMVLANLKATQRAFSLAGDVDLSRKLLGAGFHSSAAIASLSLEKFTAKFGAKDAAAIYERAKAALAGVSIAVGSIVDIVRGGFGDLGISNIGPSIQDHLKQIEGFADLFGSQDCCSCQHCQSILGPAAYFVDLMSFVEEHVIEPHFSGSKANHPLHLKMRRGDLWTLPLTCKNTDTLIPHLTIINEILETYVAKQRGYAGAPDDRAAIEKVVYEQTLATTVDSIQQPFSLPLERVDAYLRCWESSRAVVARTLRAGAVSSVLATLGLSAKEYDLVVTPKVDVAFASRVFGHSFTVSGGVVSNVDVQALVAKNRYTRTELGSLLATRFVKGSSTVAIVTEKKSVDSVQNDTERVRGLTAEVLDRLHRMTRLSRRLPWSVTEIDALLTLLEAAGVAAGLGPDTLVQLAKLVDLRSHLAVPAEQLASLFGEIPRLETTPGKGTLFDRLFNRAPFVATDGPFPKPAVTFIHPSFRASGVPLPSDGTLHRLLGGLGISDTELAKLITHLAVPLGVNLGTTNESDRGFSLSAKNLARLYRHTRLMQLLKISVDGLFALVNVGAIGGGQLNTLDDALSLLELHDYWRKSGFTLDDLGTIVHGPVQVPSSYPEPTQLAAEIIAAVAADRALEFADTVFAFLPGVTEEQSRAIIDANAATFEPAAATGALRLRASFDPTAALTIPAGVGATDGELKALLLKYHPSTIVPSRLASKLAVSAEKARALIAMTGMTLSAAPMVQAFHGGSPAPLETLVGTLVPLRVLFQKPAFDAAALEFVRANPSVFGITDFQNIGLASVRKVSTYLAFIDASRDAAFGGATADVASVQAALAGFDPVTRFSTVDAVVLAKALRVDAGLVSTLLPNVTLPVTAPEALAMLSDCAALSRWLGVDGRTLRLVLSDDYADQARAAEALLSALRARCTDDEEFAEKVEPFEAGLRGRKRDALTEYLLRSVHPEFASRSELYQHFLIDVDLEGEARTSRLVAAISSVQLYVHRCLMNLEEDRRPPSDPAHVHVPPASVPAAEWTWRKNYRVWEANRKVFLYPENYIEPELRDDKTPLFKELESTLLQQQITEQNVLDAYGSYVNGFDEISKLKIAGAFHDKHPTTESDLLHVFGVTPGDPPTYFYRTIENAHYGQTERNRGVVYGPWRKIDVQIPVRKIAPIVHLGRLFVFWVETTTTPKNAVKDGGSQFVGYKHRLTLKFTSMKLDGSWTPPQSVALSNPNVFASGDGIVDDPLADQSELDELSAAITSWQFGKLADIMKRMATPRYDTRVHPEPIDGYTLTGFQWEQVYPQLRGQELVVTGRNFQLGAKIDFYRKTIVPRSILNARALSTQKVLCSRIESGNRRMYYGYPFLFMLDTYPHAAIASDQRRIDKLSQVSESRWLAPFMTLGLYRSPLARIGLDHEIDVVNGSVGDAILDANGDLLYFQGNVRSSDAYLVTRLGTTLTETLSRTLFTGGVDELLKTSTQKSLGEAAFPIAYVGHMEYGSPTGKIDYTGSLGTYFREIFFHAPFLIANQLNSQQKFEAAQRWYRYIFDPTADEIIRVPEGLSPDERKHRMRDRVWRYLEFRNLGAPRLRDVLTDPKAIEVYKKDPFNPHAIARLRLSAYQKCIVMKYVDNLLDWGDSLFSEFTMESVNEATMLYVMAADILGPRPAELGSCGEGQVVPKTYEKIQPLVKKGSDILVELETYMFGRAAAIKVLPKKKLPVKFALEPSAIQFQKEALAGRFAKNVVATDMASLDAVTMARELVDDVAIDHPVTTARGAHVHAPVVGRGNAWVAAAGDGQTAAIGAASVRAAVEGVRAGIHDARAPVMAPVDIDTALSPALEKGLSRPGGWRETTTSSWGVTKGKATPRIEVDSPLIRDFDRIPNFGWNIVRQLSPVFCVPENADLRAYWDRVEDRLYKIRHSMDIDGNKRMLALFAPEIDPRLLVRAKASGLSLDDVLNATSGNLPPYRFSYIIEKAKQYAASVQGFGGALLSALEKRDLEELNRLRMVQQQNLLELSTKMRSWEVDVAEDAIEQLERQKAAIEYRQGYYQGLIDTDLTPWERTQQVARHTATAIRSGEATIGFLSGVLKLMPQLGSPFAMKYGGVELGGSISRFASATGTVATIAESIAASAGLEAGFERRKQGWEHQVDLAARELAQIEKQIEAAKIRREIAVRSLDVHEKSIEQLEEVFELMGSRFSSLALYTWLSTQMQRVFREAYNSAYAMARLAEQAYRFERGDETTPLLEATYWDASKAGLLSGEKLLLDLQSMERKFLETNYRSLEIDQSFSLSQIDPAALVALRETGGCEFEIDEIFFDLFYPGQYKRRIKSVRLTIPCVTGPYTNVGATLTLKSSKIRKEPKLGPASLVDLPRRRSVSVSTSTAQNDSGVFEFSFRDERYMPFEGAGAVSAWSLALPKTFRQFDYSSITEVVVHVSYTAEEDGVFRAKVEDQNAAIEGTIVNVLSNEPIGRVFSMRQDFSSALHRVIHSAEDTPVKFAITEKHLSVFLRGRPTTVARAALLLRTPKGQTVGGVQLALDGTTVSGFAKDPAFGDLWAKDITSVLASGLVKELSLAVKAAGDLAPTTPAPGDISSVDGDKLLDVAIYVEYTLS